MQPALVRHHFHLWTFHYSLTGAAFAQAPYPSRWSPAPFISLHLASVRQFKQHRRVLLKHSYQRLATCPAFAVPCRDCTYAWLPPHGAQCCTRARPNLGPPTGSNIPYCLWDYRPHADGNCWFIAIQQPHSVVTAVADVYHWI